MSDDTVPMYEATYASFADRIYADVRRAAHGRDIGQNGWLTAEEQDRFVSRLRLEPASRVLDIACGSGEPSLRMVEKTGCTLVGIDANEAGVTHAIDLATQRALADRASFSVHDASQSLPFEPRTFDAIICIDAINHLPNRRAVFDEWFRVLKPGGRLLFTDPVVVTGPVSNAEIAARSTIGRFLFVPPGLNEKLLGAAGFVGVEVESSTQSVDEIASRWRTARDVREHDLRKIEGAQTFEDIQRFLEVTARLARERRLSRMTHFARRPE